MSEPKPGHPDYLNPRPACRGGCGFRVVKERRDMKGGRRLDFQHGYCKACWDDRWRRDAAAPPPPPPLTDSQQAVLALLEHEIADDAERRAFASALGIGEP